MFKQDLIATGRFAPSKTMPARLIFEPDAAGVGYPIDLIPYGGIEAPGHLIAWPPDMALVMNVAGYTDALLSAEDVEIVPGEISRVVSIAGLAALKLIAWSERGSENSKDAQDFFALVRSYGDAGNLDRLYGEEYGFLESGTDKQKQIVIKLLCCGS